MPKLLHWRLDARRYLKLSDADLNEVFRNADGVLLPGAEARMLLTVLIEGGTSYLAVDPDCDCFTAEKGCAGHELAGKDAA